MSESLKQRVITAILMGAPILLLLFMNDTTRIVFISLLAILLLYEYLSLFYPIKSKLFHYLISFVIAIVLMFVAYSYQEYYLPLLFVSLAVNVILIINLFFGKKSLHKIAPWISGPIYLVLPLSLLFFIKDESFFQLILIGSILLSWVSDISAYFVGKSVGKHKLIPRISPGKTWEGFLGAGMIVLIFSYFFASYDATFSLQNWLLIGLCVWIFGAAGDLVESKLKRQINIKDSGSILPGHGGFLDRFDGFYFCLPFVLIIINYCN